jgi:hypothetical protein
MTIYSGIGEVLFWSAIFVSFCSFIWWVEFRAPWLPVKPETPDLWDAERYNVVCVFRGSSPDREFTVDGYLIWDNPYISGFNASTLLREKMEKQWIKIDDIYWNRNEIINYMAEKHENIIPWTKESCVNYEPIQKK